MSFSQRTWYYSLDPELRLIHIFSNCRAYKFARKYKFGKEFVLRDEADAQALDDMLRDGWKTCHSCWAREQGLAKKDHRGPRPGFKREPAP